MPQRAPLTQLERAALVAVTCLCLSISLMIAAQRFIARDEGFYLYAARLVAEGQVPYRDFFFPQTPLTPYAYGSWFALWGVGWYQGRVLAALLTVISGWCVYLMALPRYGRSVAISSFAIFSVSGAVQMWFPTAQTYSLGAVFLFGSLAALLSHKRFAVAGALFGLAILCRLPLAPVGLVFLYVIYTLPHGTRLSALLRCATGSLFPLAITALFIAAEPSNFLAHNLFYHLQRSTMSPEQLSEQRWKVLLSLIGLREGAGIGGAQYSILLYSALYVGGRQLLKERRIDPLILCAVILFVTHLTPSPTYLQYYCTVAVPLMPASVSLWTQALLKLREQLSRHLSFRTSAAITGSTFGVLLLGFAAAALPDIERFTITGDRVIGVGRQDRTAWRISTVRQISRLVNQATQPGDQLFVSWAGYAVETRSPIMRGMENHFGRLWVQLSAMSAEEQERKRVLSWARAIRRFRAGKAPIAVLYLGARWREPIKQQIVEAGGKMVAALNGVAIYRHIP